MARTFGNQGALFMNAMTWWDHETYSVWSQPWGRAIKGDLKGNILRPIPASIVPWETWLAEHPETLLWDWVPKATSQPRQLFREDYVIGVAVAGHAKGYRFSAVSSVGILNDDVGPTPVVVLADGETKEVRVYARRLGDTVFELSPGGRENGGHSDGKRVGRRQGVRRRGAAGRHPVTAPALQLLLRLGWKDFYPDSEIYGE